MANIKITELPELAATPDDADILEIVDDVAGTPTSKKITAGNLRGGFAKSGVNSDITSMTGLDAGGIPMAAVVNGHAKNADTALGAQIENLDMNTHKIIGVVDPTADQEAATKKYVDDNVGGLSRVDEFQVFAAQIM